MFNALTPMPADPILGLLTQYRQDPNPLKVDLGVGVYKDEAGNTPILATVKIAEQWRTDNEQSKVYIGPTGSAPFNQLMTELALGNDHSALMANRIRTVSTPGGTGALKVAADLIERLRPGPTIYVSDPTWANHTGLFATAGLTVRTYPYYDFANKGILFEDMLAALELVGEQDVVLLHGCCHNPSGADLTNEQWDKVVDVARRRGFLPLIDLAYQGFGSGLDEDAYGVRKMAAAVDEMLLCTSCSKNFGLYRERIGSCSIMAKTSQAADTALSIMLYVIRCIYSMPPAHGAALVETILGSQALSAQWQQEVAVMRERINGNRELLVAKLHQLQTARDFSFIANEKGMFSFLGLTPVQVKQLTADYSVYMVDSSRISIAGINQSNIDYLAKSITAVL
ncbi:MAG: amino acid aminotransferase [Shewanella sp.]